MVERIVEKPVERIVNQERIVHQDRIVYQDRIVEVPVERRVEVVPTMFQAPPIQVQQVEYTDAPLQIHQQAPSYQVFRQQQLPQPPPPPIFSSFSERQPISASFSERYSISSTRKKIGLGVLLKRSTLSQGMTFVAVSKSRVGLLPLQ